MNLQLDPHVRAVFDEIVAHTPELGPPPSAGLLVRTATTPARRPWLAVAAAAIAVAGVGGIALLANRPTTTVPASAPPAAPTTPPTLSPTTPTVPPPDPVAPPAEPTLYPVLDDVPAGLEVTTHTSRTPDEPGWTEALLGRLVDGVLVDTVMISVQSRPFTISPMYGHPPTEATVFGEPATVYDYSENTGPAVVHVTWGSGPYFLATGADPLTFLGTATADAFLVTEGATADAPPELSFGLLPAGFDAVAAPQPIGHARLGATLSVGADNYDISVGTRNWLPNMALAGSLRPVDVAGRPGWTFLSSSATQDITWQVDDTTYAYLKVNDGTDADGALALANALRFVDWDTWTAHYAPAEDEPAAVTTAPAATDPPQTDLPQSAVPPVGDVLLGSVELDGEYVGVAIVDDGHGLCRMLADGTRAGCDTIDPPEPATPSVYRWAGDLVYGYTLAEAADLTAAVDGVPLEVARADSQVAYGDVTLWMWAARLPDAEAGERLTVALDDADTSSTP
ncbi:MAG TPA: hypothetical protein VNQ73_19140 [Ilumatobacter sp.]|nr:hypothetical protein [Ilumatobacter sp.]